MNIQEGIKSAIENLNTGNLQQAELICREILKNQTENPEALHILGIVCLRIRNYDSAIHYFRRTLQIKPKLDGVHANLGIALKYKGQLDEAMTCFRKALLINPNCSIFICAAYYLIRR